MRLKIILLIAFLGSFVESCGAPQVVWTEEDASKCNEDLTRCEAGPLVNTGRDRTDPCSGPVVPDACFGNDNGGGSSTETGLLDEFLDDLFGDGDDDLSIPSGGGIKPGEGHGGDDNDDEDNEDKDDLGRFFEATGDIGTDIGKQLGKGWGKISGEYAKKKREARKAEKLVSEINDLKAQLESLNGSIEESSEQLSSHVTLLEEFSKKTNSDNTFDEIEEWRTEYNSTILPGLVDSVPNPGNALFDGQEEPFYPEAIKIKRGRSYASAVRQEITKFSHRSDYPGRVQAVNFAEGSFNYAEGRYQQGEVSEGDAAHNMGMQLLDAAIGLAGEAGQVVLDVLADPTFQEYVTAATDGLKSINPISWWIDYNNNASQESFDAFQRGDYLEYLSVEFSRTLTNLEILSGIASIWQGSPRAAGLRANQLASRYGFKNRVDMANAVAESGVSLELLEKLGPNAAKVLRSAKRSGLGKSDIDGFAKDANQVSANGLKNTSDEIANAYKIGKNRNQLDRTLSDIPNPRNDVGFRRDHILNRHKPGAGKAGKTEFPSNWNESRILHNISDVAADAKAVRGFSKYGEYAIGYRDGILIRVDLYPKTHSKYPGAISSGYPINVKPNPL